MARIARLEELVTNARLQGMLATMPAGRSSSTMTHIADMGRDMGPDMGPDIGPDLRTTPERASMGETGGPAETARTAETARPTDGGRTMASGRIPDSGRTPETSRAREAGPGAPESARESTRESTRPALGAGATADAGRVQETGRSATAPGRPPESGRITDTGRPAEAARAAMERSRTVDTRRPPNGGQRATDTHRMGDADPAVFRATQDRRNGASLGWLWALPLAAVAALGAYFMRPATEHVADTTATIAAGDVIHPAVGKLPSAGDLQRQALAAIQSLSSTVQGITDRSTAQAAMPKIQDGNRDMERLALLSTQLPADGRTALASASRDPLSKLNTLIDNASALPGVGPLLQPTVASLRGRIDAIAMTPGKPLFLASAPADWMPLSSVLNRDVQNSAGEKLGTATGFFLGPDGKIVASLVSVDRQLGIGEKQIGMPIADGQFVRQGDRWHLVINANKDDMQHAKAFETR